MRYDLEIQPGEDNTSHAVVLDLVGEGKDVLDVGCATGYLAKALREQDCTITGVEVDPDAAQLARAHAHEVIVADLDEVDLGSLPFGRRFDVVVFADVLEHLKDPVTALRSATGLLREDGFVVISIPNVAHGAVRLSLLAGRFEYSDIGLLDDTHLRFFTRSTLDDLLERTGFVVRDMRRTRAGIFETEIAIDPSTVPESVLKELEGDADAETYQFVFSAVPAAPPAAEAAEDDDPARELELLRRQLGEIVRHAGLGPAAPSVAVVASSAAGGDQVAAQAVEIELRRRLDGFRVRRMELEELQRALPADGSTDPAVDAVVLVGAVGEAVTALLGRLRASEVKVVVFGGRPAGIPADALADLPGALSGGPGEGPDGRRWCPVPDPAVAAAIVYDPALLEQRANFLRLLGGLPAADRAVALVSLTEIPAALDALKELDRVRNLKLRPVVLDPPDGAAKWQLAGREPLDVAAAVWSAAVVVSDDPAVVSIALAFGRPVVGIDRGDGAMAGLAGWVDDDLLAPGPGSIVAAFGPARARAADPRTGAALAEALVGPLDHLASTLTAIAGRRLTQTVPARLRELQDQVNVLEASNAGLLQRQRSERVAFGERAAALLGAERGAASQQQSFEVQRLREEAARLAAEAERAHLELQALLATKTLRALRPARGLYRRVRSVIR